MIYIFDKTQAIIKVLTNDDFTAAHLNFKINTATTFEFSLPASKALPSGSKYVATPHPLNDSKFIMLRLTERVDNTETIDYSAYELAYQELATDGYIEDKRPQNQSALNLMKIALDGSNWELNNVNVSGTATTNFYYVDRLSAISKVVDLLGGEIVFYIEIQGNAISGRYMDYLARQGADTSKVFASGSNLLTVERQSDTSNIYTAILPRGKGEEIDNGEADTPDGYGRRISIADVEWKKSAGNPLDKPKGSIVLSDPDATAEWGQINGNARLLLQTYDDIDDVNVLINSAYKTLQSVNHPQIQYSATVADVGGLSLGDTVLIMHGDRDLSYKTRVFEVKYDLLSPDQTELSLGDDLSSNSITSQINNVNAVADTTSSQTQWTINQIGRPGTTYGATAPDSPKVGDIWFKYLPDGGTEIYRWNGDIWELLASPTTADDIAAAVDDAVTQAKAHTDEVEQGLSSDIATAKSQATSQANAAEANAKSEATSLFSTAQNALSDAKTDLTKSIAKEASDRASAVDAANSQAQTYANQAKADALNTIAKEVTDRQNAVSALDTKATNAVNQAKSDINDTINALSVGGRNYFLNSSGVSLDKWINNSNLWSITTDSIKGNVFTSNPTVAWTSGAQNALYQGGLDALIGQQVTVSFWGKADKANANFHSEPNGGAVKFNPKLTTSWAKYSYTIPNLATTLVYFMPVDVGTNYYLDNLKIESGNKATDWTQAPEDVVLDYTTKDDQIKATITQYKTTNDGKVSKVQTDATTALGLVATKVSQTDYDTKTGDLTTKYTQVKQTTDSQATDIVDIKKTATSQASKINSISSDVDGTKQSISDIETTQDSQSDKINQITSDVNGTKQSITDIQTKDGNQDTRMGTIETSVSGVKSDFSTYKTTNDGVVKTAQTTAQTAVDGLKTKVSQTDYNTKTGQLQTDLTTTTQTANQAKTDIISIKQTNTSQDSRMNTIESDASGTKQTVSQLQTVQGQQSGDISTLQQRADGFDATVTKVNNLAVGGRNYFQIFNSVVGYINSDGTLNSSSSLGVKTSDYIKVNAGDTWQLTYWSSNPTNRRMLYAMYDSSNNLVGSRMNLDIPSDKDSATASLLIPSSGVTKIRVGAQYMSDGSSKIKAELGTIATDWTPAPEDLSSATATAQLTADEASAAVTKLTNSDGIITKAQADIRANADAITKTVSKTIYDQNNNTLNQAISKAQSTADGAVSTVGNYQTSNDERVKAAESTIEQNAKDITARVTKTDYDNNNSQLNTRFTNVEATADGASTTVGKLQTDLNGMSYENRNLLENSGFEFHVNNITGKFSVVDGSNTTMPTPFETKMGLIDNVDNQVVDDVWGLYPLSTVVTLKANVTYTLSYYFSVAGKAGYQHSDYGVDDSGNFIKGIMAEHEIPDTTGGQMVWKRYSKTFTLTTDTVLAGLRFGFVSNVDGRGWKVVDNVKLEIGSKATDYSVAPNDTTLSISQVSHKADSISNFVRDSSGNISSEFQTAFSRTSIVSGSTLASSIQTQTSSQISSALTDNNGKIISLINQDSSGVQIAGENIVLNGDTTVTGDFYAKGGNFTNLNASNMTVGTLNGNQVNITNLNASNITTGNLTGVQIGITNGGKFYANQLGTIYDFSDNPYYYSNQSSGNKDPWIRINQNGVYNLGSDGTRLSISGTVTAADAYIGSTKQYAWYTQSDAGIQSGTNKLNTSAELGMTGLRISQEDADHPEQTGGYSFLTGHGMYVGYNQNNPRFSVNTTGTVYADVIKLISGRSWQSINSATTDLAKLQQGQDLQFYVGSSNTLNLYSNEGNVSLQASGRWLVEGRSNGYIYLGNVKWTSGGTSVQMASDGALTALSSSIKYKTNIEYDKDGAAGEKLLTLDPMTWQDKSDDEEIQKYKETGIKPDHKIDLSNRRYYGMLAEDFDKAGLDDFVLKDEETGELRGIQYEKIGAALIPIIRNMRKMILEQQVDIERLKEK